MNTFMRFVTGAVIGLLLGWNGRAAETVDLDKVPLAADGTRLYPPPFMAVARTPYTIPPIPQPLHIQVDGGYPAGFSGLIDSATGQVGFPGYKNFAVPEFAFDSEKLLATVSFPYPYGRKTRAEVLDPAGPLEKDDVFELLLEPRTAEGKSLGRVYRFLGNAAGTLRTELDDRMIGQFHRSWIPAVRYGTMMWDPTHSWVGAVQIPFAELGGVPADGTTWGVQFALRYADPAITAVLSPGAEFADPARFAGLRFDWERRANFRCHWLTEEVKNGSFVLGKLFSNGANEKMRLAVAVQLFQGSREIGQGGFTYETKPLSRYDAEYNELRIPSKPAGPEARDTVARLTVTDSTFKTVIYDQYIPYWRPPPGERDWLKNHFGKDFAFNVGPYPSRGMFDWSLDCRTLLESNPAAANVLITVRREDRELSRQLLPLPKDGRLHGTAAAEKMPDGARYEVSASVMSAKEAVISRKAETFTRSIMPFESAPRPGLSDLVVPPFTPPVVKRASVACWNRVYGHGRNGLLESLTAAEEELLARPAQFLVRTGTESARMPLKGTKPILTPIGKGRVGVTQTFAGPGVSLKVTSEFDYDGFYLFTVQLAPGAEPPEADIAELLLEIPLRGECATLIEAPVEWLWKDWEKCAGFLDAAPGRLWDSKTFPYGVRVRKGNMPPYIWVGDDDRGLTYSCVSEAGMHNDDAKPAATLDREGREVVLRVWLVNNPFRLTAPREMQFALQASPFKPYPAYARLWRTISRKDARLGTYGKHGRFFHSGWGVGCYYPTYGRFLDLEKNRVMLDKVKADGFDLIPASASSCSECGGTPEYKQFWREWGSELGWDKLSRSPVPEWARKVPEFNDPLVMTEAASNSSLTNVDYRVWWLTETVRKSGTSFIYQDNPPYNYHFQPAIGYGFVREDGVAEPTNASWNARGFMRRVAHSLTENGVTDTPYVWPNICGSAQPGRSFCGKGLIGESPESDRIPLGSMRIWFSKQWGMPVDWLMQEPGSGASGKYWRALGSRLFLMDVTNFSRWDTADMAVQWLQALDLFWLDDPAVVWHPYYREPVLKSAFRSSTLVSAYTGPGRALFVVSNQGDTDLVEKLTFKSLDKFGAGGLQFFYDAETGERVEFANDVLTLFIPTADFRLVLGVRTEWAFAAENRFPGKLTGPQSSVDARLTLAAISRQLLKAPRLEPVADGHRLTEAWAGAVLAEMAPDGGNRQYLDASACADLDLGDRAVHARAAEAQTVSK